jgi:P-type Ca2+ transporter type 2C
MPNNTSGLSSSEAKQGLTQWGFNEIPINNQHSFLQSIYEVLTEPMFGLLILAGLIYLMLGDVTDALTLMGFITISIGITLFQQEKSRKAIEALKELSSPRALVIRDGKPIRIPGREVVVGDLLVIEEGDRIPADALLVQCNDLLIDESLLTGESEPVSKKSEDSIHSGCLAIRGSGQAMVTQTGIYTELGKIGKSLQDINQTKSPLQKEISSLIKRFALFGFCVALLVFLIYGFIYKDWLQGALSGISLTMALLPEEFTVILTVFMALGAWRISQQQVLTRHAPVIETLGSITTLCVDKTGTLTENKMSLQTLATTHQVFDIQKQEIAKDNEAKQLLKIAVLASEKNPFDPMEQAFCDSFKKLYPHELNIYPTSTLAHEYGLSPELPAMTHLWKTSEQSNQYLVAIKGSPEAIMRLCRLPEDKRDAIEQQIQKMASEGLRLLAVAQAEYTKNQEDWPTDIHSFEFNWLGLLGLKDPIRSEVPQAIQQCQQAGIRVIMITGDHAITAQAIAKQAGIRSLRILSGLDLANMSDEALKEAVQSTSIFVRIKPDQKLRLVKALQQNQHVVAMTGDGINDAPALKAAHVGISMGQRGTDVAREASSLVLLNDDFSSIVNAIKQGRQIYDNLHKAIAYVVAIHIPVAASVFIPIVLGAPPMLSPIHILFLEMIIDPACAIVFEMEPPEDDLMNQAPRNPDEKMFNLQHISMAIIQGIGLSIAVLALYLGLPGLDVSLMTATTIGFATLVLGNILLIIATRSNQHHLLSILRKPNPSQKWLIGLTLGSFALLLFFPALRTHFSFSHVSLEDMLLIIGASLACLAWYELTKWCFYKISLYKSNRSF